MTEAETKVSAEDVISPEERAQLISLVSVIKSATEAVEAAKAQLQDSTEVTSNAEAEVTQAPAATDDQTTKTLEEVAASVETSSEKVDAPTSPDLTQKDAVTTPTASQSCDQGDVHHHQRAITYAFVNENGERTTVTSVSDAAWLTEADTKTHAESDTEKIEKIETVEKVPENESATAEVQQPKKARVNEEEEDELV